MLALTTIRKARNTYKKTVHIINFCNDFLVINKVGLFTTTSVRQSQNDKHGSGCSRCHEKFITH